MIICASPSTVAAPPMSFFISSMPDDGLISSPPVSKQTPLPTSVSVGPAVAPAQVDQPRRAGRGAPDRMDHRKVLLQQRVAHAPRSPGPKARAPAPETAASSSSGPMSEAGVLIRSRVSASPAAIASIRAASTPAGACNSAPAARRGVVTVKPILRQKPAQRRLFRRLGAQRPHQPPDARRQGSRRLRHHEPPPRPRLRIAQPHHRPGQRPVRARQQTTSPAPASNPLAPTQPRLRRGGLARQPRKILFRHDMKRQRHLRRRRQRSGAWLFSAVGSPQTLAHPDRPARGDQRDSQSRRSQAGGPADCSAEPRAAAPRSRASAVASPRVRQRATASAASRQPGKADMIGHPAAAAQVAPEVLQRAALELHDQPRHHQRHLSIARFSRLSASSRAEIAIEHRQPPGIEAHALDRPQHRHCTP